MHISVVATLYQSSPYIDDFYKRITSTVEKITSDFEIIFVNDGHRMIRSTVQSRFPKLTPKCA